MLLLGTRRFPAEGGFNDHLARQGCDAKAWTSLGETNFRLAATPRGYWTQSLATRARSSGQVLQYRGAI